MNGAVRIPAARRQTPIWIWVVACLFALALMIVLAAVGWVLEVGIPPVHLTIDGVEQVRTLNLDALAAEHKVALVVGVLIVAIAAVVAMPIALLAGLAGLVVALVFLIGFPLLMLVVILGLVLSPVLLAGLLLWWLWRRSIAMLPPRASDAANIRE